MCGTAASNTTRIRLILSTFGQTGRRSLLPPNWTPDSILLPLYGQVPLELHCFDLMEYAVRHRLRRSSVRNSLSSQIRAILYQLSLTMQKRALWSKQENGMAYRILNFIDDNKGRQLQTQDYAEAFGKSYRRLNTIFLSVYGMTIKQMQIVLRIDQAKRMLSSGYSIARHQRSLRFRGLSLLSEGVQKQNGHDAFPVPKLECRLCRIPSRFGGNRQQGMTYGGRKQTPPKRERTKWETGCFFPQCRGFDRIFGAGVRCAGAVRSCA